MWKKRVKRKDSRNKFIIILVLIIILIIGVRVYILKDEPFFSPPAVSVGRTYTISIDPEFLGVNSGASSHTFYIPGSMDLKLDLSKLTSSQRKFIVQSISQQGLGQVGDERDMVQLAITNNFPRLPRTVTIDSVGINFNSFDGYIVEFIEEPIITRGTVNSQDDVLQLRDQYISKIEREQKSAMDDIRARIKDFRSGSHDDLSTNKPIVKSDSFSTVLNGVVIKDITPGEINAIASSPFVKRVYPNRIVYSTLVESVPLIGAPLGWSFGSTGKGISIGVIDTGVDYNHPDLGGCFGEGCKVAGGWDFSNNDGNPMDDQGHGTHVAATAAGGNFIDGGDTEIVLKDPDEYSVVRTDDSNVVLYFSNVNGPHQFAFGYGQNRRSGSILSTLASGSVNADIYVEEGSKVGLGEYQILGNDGEASIIRIDEIFDGTDDFLTVFDVLNGDILNVVIDGDRQGTLSIGGENLFVSFVDGFGQNRSWAQFTWGEGATYGENGNEITLAPALRSENGSLIVIATADNILNKYGFDCGASSGSNPVALGISNINEYVCIATEGLTDRIGLLQPVFSVNLNCVISGDGLSFKYSWSFVQCDDNFTFW